MKTKQILVFSALLVVILGSAYFLGLSAGRADQLTEQQEFKNPQSDEPLVEAVSIAPHAKVATEFPEDRVSDEEGLLECNPSTEDCKDVGMQLVIQAQEDYLENVLTQALMDRASGKLDVVSEADRLDTYADFSLRPVDPVWSAQIRHQFESAILQATQVGQEVTPDSIDCRTSTCLIRYVRNTAEDEFEVLSDLNVILGLSRLNAQSQIYQTSEYNDVYITDIKPFELP